MEIVTISGKIMGNCESRKDKNNNTFIRFKVCCTGKDYSGNPKYTTYRCFCYDTMFGDLKNGDTVFLSGDMNVNVRQDENGKPLLNIDVYVKNITKG